MTKKRHGFIVTNSTPPRFKIIMLPQATKINVQITFDRFVVLSVASPVCTALPIPHPINMVDPPKTHVELIERPITLITKLANKTENKPMICF